MYLASKVITIVFWPNLNFEEYNSLLLVLVLFSSICSIKTIEKLIPVLI